MLHLFLNRASTGHLSACISALAICLSSWAQPTVGASSPTDDARLEPATETAADAKTAVLSAQLQIVPTPFKAVYKADYKGLPVRATGIRELQRDADNRFVLTSTATSIFASVSEVSHLTLTPENKLMPTEYQYHRQGIGKNRDTVLRFDWPSRQVLSLAPGDLWTLQIPPGALDKLPYQLQMRYELLTAYRQQQPWPHLSYQVADDGQLKTYSFEVLGEENVTTPIGNFTALKISRIRTESARTTTFWLAPAYDFLLIRFLQEETKGGGFELTLKEAYFQGQVIKGTPSPATRDSSPG